MREKARGKAAASRERSGTEDSMSMEAIGKNIALFRKEKGATQEQLAKYVGVSPQAVSKWENGGVPDTELLAKIADFFETTGFTLSWNFAG